MAKGVRMHLSQFYKKSVVFLAVCALAVSLTGCAKENTEPVAAPTVNPDAAPTALSTPTPTPAETVPPEDDSEDLNKLSEISTDYGTLYVPQRFKKLLQTEVSSGKNGGTVKFSVQQDGKTYKLFDVSIGDEVGQLVGTLTDNNGTSRNVYVTVYDLGDISKLENDKQDQLYALQEAVNAVAENLK